MYLQRGLSFGCHLGFLLSFLLNTYMINKCVHLASAKASDDMLLLSQG